jgi:hypothetical protein
MSSQDHRTGRPLRTSNHSTTNITIRLTAEERAALDSHVALREEPYSALVREAMEQAGLFKRARAKR